MKVDKGEVVLSFKVTKVFRLKQIFDIPSVKVGGLKKIERPEKPILDLLSKT